MIRFPSFDPFAQDPAQTNSPTLESNLPAPPAAPSSFNPFEDKPHSSDSSTKSDSGDPI